MAESRGVQTIIRTVKDRSNPYVIVNNTVFTDPRISWKAKGLMGYFLSRPDDWRVAVGDLVRRSRDGREAVYSGLRELIERGYVVRTPVRGAGGRIIRWEYLVYETPRPPAGEPQAGTAQDASPLTGFPEVAEPDLANPPQPSTEEHQGLKETNNNRGRGSAAKDRSPDAAVSVIAEQAPPAAAVVVKPSSDAQDGTARPPSEEGSATATVPVKANPCGATAGGGCGPDGTGGGRDQRPGGPDVFGPVERVRARYREVTGVDDLRPAFARKLLTRYGPAYVEEKLALLEAWLRAKRAAGERVTPLRAFLDALRHDWPAPGVVRDRRDPVAETRRLLDEYDQAAKRAVPPEAALAYLRQMRETLRRGAGP